MSVLRQLNILGQMRVDVPHLRSIESSIAGDFDVVVGRSLAGDRGLIVRGFTLTNTSVGTNASEIQLLAADSIVYNVNASESGSFLWVPSDRAAEQLSSSNAKVSGSFTANAVNYVGVDFKRSADNTTTDLVQFLDANTKLESGRNIPLGRTLDYVIIISTAPFSTSPNVVPVAKVTTDTSNKVSSIQDARPMMYRLAAGGDFPNTQSSYTFPFGRQENNVTNTFTGGDKNILSNKDWMDSVMTRIWELGGGENWYSPTHPKNIRLVRAPAPAVFGNGENWETIGTHTHWQGLSLVFENANSTGVFYNEIKDQLTDDVVNLQTQLAPGDCLYVDVDFTQNRTGANALVMRKAALQTLGSPTVPGARLVIAWRSQNAGSVDVYTRDYPYLSNVTILPATTVSVGGVRLNEAAATGATPTVITIAANNQVHVGAAPYAPTGNNTALVVTGAGSGIGLQSTGGATTGIGIKGIGGGLSGTGIQGIGAGGSVGIGSTGHGVIGAGSTGGAGGIGIVGEGFAAGYGGAFTPGTTATTAIFANGAGGTNTHGLLATAAGTGSGVSATGGATSGSGGTFTGGTGNSAGVVATAVGTGSGVVGLGAGSTLTVAGTLAGGSFKGPAAGGDGVDGFGVGIGIGVIGVGGATSASGVAGLAGSTSNGAGVRGTGDGTGSGVVGTGGGSNGTGVVGTGGATNGKGVQGTGAGTGAGVVGYSSTATGSPLTNVGGSFFGTNVALYALGSGSGAQGALISGNSAGNSKGLEAVGYGTGYAIEAYDGTAVTNRTIAHLSGYVLVDSTDPTATTAFTDTITAKNITKVWADISVPTSDGACTINDGFNLTSVSVASDTVTITINDNFSSANYGVSVAPDTTAGVGISDVIWRVSSKAAGTISLKARYWTGATFADLPLGSTGGSVIVRLLVTAVGAQ